MDAPAPADPLVATSAAATPLEFPACAVCGGTQLDVVCDAAEIRAQLAWVERFHLRRLAPSRGGAPAREALEDRAAFTQSFATNVVACRVCGLLFRDPRPTADAVAQAYAHDQYGAARLAALFDAQRALYREKMPTLRRWLPPHPRVRVLEIGSFVGGFLDAALAEGWIARGVDPGEEVGAFCRARGLPVVAASVDELREPDGAFDAVAIWNTFDQLPDPRATVTAAARLLRPGGLLAVRVPNGLCFRRAVGRVRRWPGPLADALRAALAWNNLLGFPYLYGYTPFTLVRLLGTHGFQTLALRPDTLVRLADATTRGWAAVEERLVKSAWRAAWTLAGRRGVEGAPWLDVYLRRTP